MAARKGNYSNIIVYDERRRYYYMSPQKNKPFLDDEIRDMGIGLLDQVRRAVQNIYGDVAAPYTEYSSGAQSTTDSFRVRQATDNDRNFTVTGGSSLDRPAVLFAKGYYIFLTGDLEYKYQQYPSDTIDIQTQSDKSLTLSPIPALTTPNVDRIDVVYVDLHFEEVTAVSGTDADVYRDTGLKNPVVGTETANRLRAVIDIKVKEGWTSTVTKDIFDDVFFLGATPSSDYDPTDNHYKIPIAIIYRDAFSNLINDSQIVDLLALYNKRAFGLGELSYRVRNGGYTETGVYELSLSGFTPQHPAAVYDEGAFATGLNQGLGTEALNTNSVTPRILDNNGRFFMRGLMVGHDTGLIAYETGAEALGIGEMIVQDLSARSIYAGYGVTGITGMREYKDSVSVVVRGETGRSGFSVMNMDGVTGSKTVYVRSVQGGQQQNFFVVDYAGRIGLNTFRPGWDQPLAWENTDRYNDGLHGETGVNIVQEINGSLRLTDHVFADKDMYVSGEIHGQSWKIPAALSDQNPALFGFTGIHHAQFAGITGSIAAVVFKRGIAVSGETGITAYGYTGMAAAGQYECYDSEGKRMFTIGDLGDDFDRTVMSLYGTSLRKALTSDVSLLDIHDGVTDLGEIQAGDTVTYDIALEGGVHVTGSVTVTAGGMAGVEEVRQDILANGDFPAGYTRTGFDYIFYEIDGTPTLMHDGVAYGVQILTDPLGHAQHDYDIAHSITPVYPMDDGKIILKDMPEDPIHVALDVVSSFTVTRLLSLPVSITFTAGSYYGAVDYGGSITNVKFAKLDLGEGADGWLFNGDVFFNGNGLSNRVTFSPNVMFRNDVFIYGTLFSDQQFFNLANVQSLFVRKNVNIVGQTEIAGGLALGSGSLAEMNDKLKDTVNYSDLLLYIKGMLLSRSLEVRDADSSVTTLGTIKQTSVRDSAVSARIGGPLTDYGIHLVDNRPTSSLFTEADRFTEVVIDASDGLGNERTASLRIKGDLVTDRYFSANYLGAGNIPVLDTDYKLQVNGKALISDTLRVKAIEFTGTDVPEAPLSITDPSNITALGRVLAGGVAGEDYSQNKNPGNILRTKEFTSTQRVLLSNGSELGVLVYTDLYQNYFIEHIYNGYADPYNQGAVVARWAFDNIGILEKEFDAIVGTVDSTPDTVDVTAITLPQYQRYKCERIRVCSLGQLTMTWTGYRPGSGVVDTIVPISSVAQSYKFTSNYFRNVDGGATIDWMPGSAVTNSDNFVVRIEANIINTKVSESDTKMHRVDQCLHLYIPLSKWTAVCKGGQPNTAYESIAPFYRWEDRSPKLNIVDFYDQTSAVFDQTASPSAWKAAIYPRLISQSRTTSGAGDNKIYTGVWSLDVVLLPDGSEELGNLTGKTYISYFQG